MKDGHLKWISLLPSRISTVIQTPGYQALCPLNTSFLPCFHLYVAFSNFIMPRIVKSSVYLLKFCSHMYSWNLTCSWICALLLNQRCQFIPEYTILGRCLAESVACVADFLKIIYLVCWVNITIFR